jgi:glycosyltransferase involved in cell wall biosynthesis
VGEGVKVLVVSSTALRTPPKSYGGLEAVAYQSALYLHRQGYEVTLVAATLPGAYYPFRTIELPPGSPPDFEQPLDLITERDVKSFDLVIDHSHSHRVGIKANSIGVKSMCVHHDLMPGALGCTAHYAVSRAHASYFESIAGVKAGVIYDMVDTSNVRPSKKEPILLWVGRVNKGLTNWLRWVKAFKEMYRGEVTPVVIGDDSAMAGVNIDQMREIKRLVEETNAIYYGLTDRKTLTYYLGKAVATYSAFLPGYIEVFGMWAVEAMAANSVPLAPHQDVLREILPGYFESKGLPFPPFRFEDISLITRRALESPFEDLSPYARRFSPEVIGKTYEEEIMKLSRLPSS